MQAYKITKEDVNIKRNHIYDDVEKLCWKWGLYPKGNLKLYSSITDIILKHYLKAKKRSGEITYGKQEDLL